MERKLPHPLQAEIEDTNGQYRQVMLTAYLGKEWWRATDTQGGEVIVDGRRILALNHADARRAA